jgi:PHD/YefM family antitoxin component YafN of YafNO toxin-antitoxin module
MIITANEVKKRGVSVFDDSIDKYGEVVISTRGVNKYVVVSMERYNFLREAELDKAYLEAMKDYKNGDYHTSVKKHLKKIKNA